MNFFKKPVDTTEVFNEYFHQIDGIEYPLDIILNEPENFPHIKNSQYTINAIRENIEYNIKETKKENFFIRRNIYDYEKELGMSFGAIKILFNKITKNRSNISCLDLGSGQSNVLDTIQTFHNIQKENLVGITLPHNKILKNIEDRIIMKDISQIKAKKKFDVIFSIWGAIEYHPLNSLNRIFSILHYLSFAKKGSILMNPNLINFELIRNLEKENYLTHIDNEYWILNKEINDNKTIKIIEKEFPDFFNSDEYYYQFSTPLENPKQLN